MYLQRSPHYITRQPIYSDIKFYQSPSIISHLLTTSIASLHPVRNAKIRQGRTDNKFKTSALSLHLCVFAIGTLLAQEPLLHHGASDRAGLYEADDPLLVDEEGGRDREDVIEADHAAIYVGQQRKVH